MRATIKHPSVPSQVANYGRNGALSWFVEVRQAGKLLVEYDALVTGRPTTPAGIIAVLVQHGFFSDDDLQAARDYLQVVEFEDIEEPGPRLAAEVVEKLREAGS